MSDDGKGENRYEIRDRDIKLCGMARKKRETLTARQFAKRAGVAYATVMKWLKENLIPGAKIKNSPQFGKYWDIPASSLKKVAKRKPGPKKGSKRKSA